MSNAVIHPHPPVIASQKEFHKFCEKLMEKPDGSMVPAIQQAFSALSQAGNDTSIFMLGNCAVTVETMRHELPILAKVAGKFSEAHLVNEKQAQPMLKCIKSAIVRTEANKVDKDLLIAREKLLINSTHIQEPLDDSSSSIFKRTLSIPIEFERSRAQEREEKLELSKAKYYGLAATSITFGVGVGGFLAAAALVPPLLPIFVALMLFCMVGAIITAVLMIPARRSLKNTESELEASLHKIEALKNAKAFFDSDAFKQQMLKQPPTAQEIDDMNDWKKLIKFAEQKKAELME